MCPSAGDAVHVEFVLLEPQVLRPHRPRYIVTEQFLLLDVESPLIVLINPKKRIGSSGPMLGKPPVIEDDCRHIAGQDNP